jgi:hypothetical protein
MAGKQVEKIVTYIATPPPDILKRGILGGRIGKCIVHFLKTF